MSAAGGGDESHGSAGARIALDGNSICQSLQGRKTNEEIDLACDLDCGNGRDIDRMPARDDRAQSCGKAGALAGEVGSECRTRENCSDEEDGTFRGIDRDDDAHFDGLPAYAGTHVFAVHHIIGDEVSEQFAQ